MSQNKILKLLERWDGPRNEYWIGVEPLAAKTYHIFGEILLGPECKSLEDVERVAADIRADLDEIVAEAREKIAKHNPI